MEEAKGFCFPFRIDPSTGGVEWASGNEKIRQNIRVILGVRHGERPMVRDFGTPIHSQVHNPNDEALGVLVQKQIQEALLVWEPRVIVTSARVEQVEGELQLHVMYRHVSEPIVDEFILPLKT